MTKIELQKFTLSEMPYRQIRQRRPLKGSILYKAVPKYDWRFSLKM